MDTTSTIETPTDNVVDKAAVSATKAVDATKSAATAALDSLTAKVESMRSTLSPALENATAPFESVVQYTREKPVNALIASAVVGAILMALLRPRLR